MGNRLMELFNSRLRVDFAAPGTLYRGSRYDWTGFVTQVTLDNRHTFCTSESLVPGQGNGGIGLCNEFGIFTPLGFDSAAPGQSFPKLGVGLLTRPDRGEYEFIRPYAVQPFPMQATQTDTAHTVIVEPAQCRGFAARLEKTISIHENQLSIAYCLQNVGEEPLRTEEYAHNYFAIDGFGTEPAYTLTVPPEVGGLLLSDQQRKAEDGIMPILERVSQTDRGQEFRLSRTPAVAFYLRAASSATGLSAPVPAGSWWQLTHSESGVCVRETSDFDWGNFALYGTAHSLSPEVFIRITILPGETQAWSRHYTFFTK